MLCQRALVVKTGLENNEVVASGEGGRVLQHTECGEHIAALGVNQLNLKIKGFWNGNKR